MIASETTLLEAAKHLAAHDPVLAPVITAAGPCTIRPHKNYYQELVDSIISQQLSIKAAATIERRFRELFGTGNDFPPPQAILTKTIDELRSTGLSRGKAAYVRDLAQHVVDGKVRFDHLDNLTNDQVAHELTAVKGIGEWTAHMFLMFCMGRLDVLAYGDLGIRNGIQKLYNLGHTPNQSDIEGIATTNNWHPYETVACWYIWHALDTKANP
ncbi:MAG TPA: DNA-3-methyladenine glycosylase [Candidatus Saccharimonadales bacterium]|nr:DNA-3-methyladenine glycosylase [Candidatus Saccharimonadales bacterium]